MCYTSTGRTTRQERTGAGELLHPVEFRHFRFPPAPSGRPAARGPLGAAWGLTILPCRSTLSSDIRKLTRSDNAVSTSHRMREMTADAKLKKRFYSMPDDLINLGFAGIALEHTSGSSFEDFVNAFMPAMVGEAFVPLGGTKDGGADAFLDSGLFQSGMPTVFYQASTEAKSAGKIRRTVKRLQEFGRNPKTVGYITSRTIRYLDRTENTLSSELGVVIKIRDCSYIISHLNDSAATRAAFNSYLAPSLAFLQETGGARLATTQTEGGKAAAVYVFLRQELERHAENDTELAVALADGLILWALEGTDPDHLVSSNQILSKIEAEIPGAGRVLQGVLPDRLVHLAQTPKGKGRPVRRYPQSKKFCLAYDLRERIQEDNGSDEILRLSVLNCLEARISDALDPSAEEDLPKRLAQLSITAVERLFETEGLKFAAFLQGTIEAASQECVGDQVDHLLEQQGLPPDIFGPAKDAVMSALQTAFYASSEDERLFFSKLSATYTLLFCLSGNPQVVEYFQTMASDLRLYVGSDILVRALSERYLRPQDQMMRNTLAMIRDAGGILILSEGVLTEVATHIAATDNEFRGNYAAVEASINEAIARNSDRILIRAYFYAKLRPPPGITGPLNWQHYVDQFCDNQRLHSQEGREEIRHYLLSQFDLNYEDRATLAELCVPQDVARLSKQLVKSGKDPRLADNDALLANGVYATRRARGELRKSSEFGFRTWWLTSESAILSHTRELVKRHGARYLMRPDFVLHFLALAPSAAAIRRSYRTIFPSVLSLHLSRRVESRELYKVLQQVGEAQELEPGRREAKIAQLADRLKTTKIAGPLMTSQEL